MGRSVVFLGAGASKALGLPLTNEIFPLLLEGLRTGKVRKSSDGGALFGGDAKDQKRLRECLQAILPGLDDLIADSQDLDAWRDALPPITDVLATLDYFLLSTNAPDPKFTLSELARARMLLERAVFELLVRNESPDALGIVGVPDEVRNEWRQTAKVGLLPPRFEDQSELRRTVDWLGERMRNDHVTIISTNYDIEVEQALYVHLGYHVFDRVDFGTDVRDPASGTVFRRPVNAQFDIYKLHGSLNWLRCGL
jgi:hypothetical protein